jgi:hypothetical protein
MMKHTNKMLAMEMMNSCSAEIPFKYLVFSLEFSLVLDLVDLTSEFTLNLKLVGSICLS